MSLHFVYIIVNDILEKKKYNNSSTMWYFIALYDNYKSFACDLYVIMIYNTILVLNHYYLLYLLKVN